jgi:hypothetical protein
LAVLLTALTVAAVSAPAVADWKDVEPGLAVYRGQYDHRQPIGKVAVTALRFNAKTFRLRVIAPSAGRTRSSLATTSLTLRSLMGTPTYIAGTNGGFVTSLAFPKPVGLAKADGVLGSPASTGSQKLTGVVCIEKSGAVSLVPHKSPDFAKCQDALQAGPFIIDPGPKNGIFASESPARAFERTAICIDASSNILLVHTGPSALHDLGRFLLVGSQAGGFGCQLALNLDGDASSGIYWRDGSRQFQSLGEVDALLSTALVVTRR